MRLLRRRNGRLNLGKQVVFFVILLVVLAFTAPLRIVTLGPAVTNQILLAGMGKSIVGKTSYCDSSAGIAGKTVVVGSLLTLSVETIVAMKPSIVFASGLTPPAIQDQLKKMGIRVVALDDPKSFLHLCDNFKIVCSALNVSQRGDSIVHVAEKKYAKLQHDLAGKTVRRAFVQLGGTPLYTVIKGTLGDDLIRLVGGVNLFDLTKSGEVSRESVIQKNPELILLSDMGFSTKDEIRRWKECRSITAVQRNALYVVDSYAIGSPTPLSYIQTIESIRRQIGFYRAK